MLHEVKNVDHTSPWVKCWKLWIWILHNSLMSARPEVQWCRSITRPPMVWITMLYYYIDCIRNDYGDYHSCILLVLLLRQNRATGAGTYIKKIYLKGFRYSVTDLSTHSLNQSAGCAEIWHILYAGVFQERIF